MMSLPIFPDLPSMAWNSKKYQRWDTVVKKSGTRKRKTLSRWAYPEWEIQCSYTSLNQSEIEKAAGFFGMVRGQAQEFLWKDPEDYRQVNVQIGVGSGVATEFQLLKNLGGYYVEPVRDIIDGTLAVFADGEIIPVTLGIDGLITSTPPATSVVTATFDYYWRVAFKDDDLDWDNFWYNYYKLNAIAVVTV
jgi:uncharacterized protein (TIGR02217 family)